MHLAANYLQEPGRYLPGSVLVAHLKLPTCVGVPLQVSAEVPAEFIGVRVMVLPWTSLGRSVAAEVVTVITPLSSVATEATYFVLCEAVSQPHPPAPGVLALVVV